MHAFEERSDSGESQNTIEVRSDSDAGDEEKKLPGDDVSFDPEYQPDIEMRSKVELSWRRDQMNPQMEPTS